MTLENLGIFLRPRFFVSQDIIDGNLISCGEDRINFRLNILGCVFTSQLPFQQNQGVHSFSGGAYLKGYVYQQPLKNISGTWPFCQLNWCDTQLSNN